MIVHLVAGWDQTPFSPLLDRDHLGCQKESTAVYLPGPSFSHSKHGNQTKLETAQLTAMHTQYLLVAVCSGSVRVMSCSACLVCVTRVANTCMYIVPSVRAPYSVYTKPYGADQGLWVFCSFRVFPFLLNREAPRRQARLLSVSVVVVLLIAPSPIAHRID